MESYVYILKNPSFSSLKIGFSKDVEKRIAALNTSTPTDFELVAKYKVLGGLKTEKRVHEDLENYRVNREYFNISEKLAMDLVSSVVAKENFKFEVGDDKYDKMFVTEESQLVDVLVQQRKKMGASQEDISNLCDISINGLSKMESGRNKPKLETVFKLSELLGIKICVFYEK